MTDMTTGGASAGGLDPELHRLFTSYNQLARDVAARVITYEAAVTLLQYQCAIDATGALFQMTLDGKLVRRANPDAPALPATAAMWVSGVPGEVAQAPVQPSAQTPPSAPARPAAQPAARRPSAPAQLPGPAAPGTLNEAEHLPAPAAGQGGDPGVPQAPWGVPAPSGQAATPFTDPRSPGADPFGRATALEEDEPVAAASAAPSWEAGEWPQAWGEDSAPEPSPYGSPVQAPLPYAGVPAAAGHPHFEVDGAAGGLRAVRSGVAWLLSRVGVGARRDSAGLSLIRRRARGPRRGVADVWRCVPLGPFSRFRGALTALLLGLPVVVLIFAHAPALTVAKEKPAKHAAAAPANAHRPAPGHSPAKPGPVSSSPSPALRAAFAAQLVSGDPAKVAAVMAGDVDATQAASLAAAWHALATTGMRVNITFDVAGRTRERVHGTLQVIAAGKVTRHYSLMWVLTDSGWRLASIPQP